MRGEARIAPKVEGRNVDNDSLASREETGSLGLKHLKRPWSATRLARN